MDIICYITFNMQSKYANAFECFQAFENHLFSHCNLHRPFFYTVTVQHSIGRNHTETDLTVTVGSKWQKFQAKIISLPRDKFVGSSSG